MTECSIHSWWQPFHEMTLLLMGGKILLYITMNGWQDSTLHYYEWVVRFYFTLLWMGGNILLYITNNKQGQNILSQPPFFKNILFCVFLILFSIEYDKVFMYSRSPLSVMFFQSNLIAVKLIRRKPCRLDLLYCAPALPFLCFGLSSQRQDVLSLLVMF
jgi:hypothetical protein